MKLAGPSFYQQPTAFAYEKASPFAEKFDTIIQYVKESGIMKTQEVKRNVTIHSLQTSSSIRVAENTIIQQLTIVSVVGFLSSTLIFLWELTSMHVFAFQT